MSHVPLTVWRQCPASVRTIAVVIGVDVAALLMAHLVAQKLFILQEQLRNGVEEPSEALESCDEEDSGQLAAAGVVSDI